MGGSGGTVAAEAAAYGAEAAISRLPSAVLLRVLQLLPPNELPCTARLVCTEWRQLCSSPQHRTVRLSQPLPPHAGGWWQCWEGGLRRLTFRAKLGLLELAAASGCETSLGVAWRLVQPGLIGNLATGHLAYSSTADVGVAAARSRHAHLLPWLVANRCPLDPLRTLKAVAEHCDLEALQAAWALLRSESAWQVLAVAAAAARSRTPDALDKLEWALDHVPQSERHKLAQDVASAGDLPRLRWLLERGVQPDGEALVAALVSPTAGVEVVEWLEQQGAGSAAEVCRERGRASYNKLEWVASHPGFVAPPKAWQLACWQAARAGDLPAVAHLHEARGADLSPKVWEAALESGNMELLVWLLGRGCARGPDALHAVARLGRVDLLAWLLREAGQPLPPSPMQDVIDVWPHRAAPGHGDTGAAGEAASAGGGAGGASGLLCAVRLLADAGAVVEGPDALDAAARRGDLALVRLLVSLGGSWTEWTLVEAAKGGCEELLEWLLDQGAQAGQAVRHFRVYEAACENGDAATLRALLRLGVPCGREVLAQVQREYPAVARVLLNEVVMKVRAG